MFVREGPPESDVGATLKINLTALGIQLGKPCEEHRRGLCGRRSSATPTAAASIGWRTPWPNRAAGPSLSPILPRPGAFALRRRMPRSTFFTGCTLAPRAGLRSLTRNPSSTAPSSSPSGTLSPGRTDGRGGRALNVDTGENRLGLIDGGGGPPLRDGSSFLNHGVTLLMSTLSSAEQADDPHSERSDCLVQRTASALSRHSRLRRPAPPAILLHRKSRFDLVRADSALLGIDPTPGSPNPMLPVVELSARIVHVRDMTSGQSFIDAEPKRRRLAMGSVGQADGFPRSWHPKSRLHAIVGGYRCPVAPSSLDLLAIDITDLPDARAGSMGEMATLIGSAITIDEVAVTTQSTGREVLTALGNRFHRIYYAT